MDTPYPSNDFEIIYQNTIKMLKKRHYYIKKSCLESPKNGCNPSYEILLKKELIVSPNNTKKYGRVLVHFSSDKFGVKLLRSKIKELTDAHIGHVIFVLNNKFTSHAKRLIKAHPGIEYETFFWNEMIFSAIDHVLVPKHSLLTKTEKLHFISIFGTKIPGIKKTDRICRYYYGQIGDIFEIRRKQEIYYRIVIP